MPASVTLRLFAWLVLVALTGSCVALETSLRSWLLSHPPPSTIDPTQPTATSEAAASLSPLAQPEETTITSGAEALLDLLHYVPNEPVYRRYVAYADATAWYTAWGLPRPTSFDELRSGGEQALNMMNVFSQQTIPSDLLQRRFLRQGDMRTQYGFNLFDIDRLLVAGQLPFSSITIAETTVPAAQIEAALLDFGYAAAPWQAGSLLYSRDGQAELSHIAVAKGMILCAWATEHIEAMGDAINQGHSLADDPAYLAAVTALADPALASRGALVGVILMSQPVPDDLPATLARENEAVRAQLERYAEQPLPPYAVTLFATHQATEAAYLSLITTFSPSTDAAGAAVLLGERLQNYMRFFNQRSLAEDWSLVEATGEEINQLPVAVVTMRIRTPAQPVELLTLAWNGLIFTNDLLFLMPGQPPP